MSIKDVLEIAKRKRLGNRASLECEILLCNILKKDRIFLHLYDDLKVSNHTLKELLNQVDLLNMGYPIEYITKQVSFFSQTFFIDEGALIPRPETEILVTKTSNVIKQYNIKQIFEIGVGSGVVSIMLCMLHKDLKVIATDISLSALNIARKNIELKSAIIPNLKERISLVKTNLLDGVLRNNNDLIVSNPPYINNDYAIPKNLSYEPKDALFGGKNGDEIIKKIINLNPTFLCLEIGFDQEYIQEYLSNYKYIDFYRDYSNFIRGFVARKI
ncbi:hypothetical protein CCY99_00750 [Helicobacter sp. 16-1353]|uniref:HemK/PrmC family methyltransferase n=1 Tax=Helicobacter sp. 16-1353 TaxID=2004996 RepID=UPI000DCB21B9|nr:HemK/PrmC family methyltransferase [Helicobacter sp. 16-1353]RAX55261.1 hypothetical protein CCY99_00750 [Helicobacter sp. 16-1353]